MYVQNDKNVNEEREREREEICTYEMRNVKIYKAKKFQYVARMSAVPFVFLQIGKRISKSH